MDSSSDTVDAYCGFPSIALDSKRYPCIAYCCCRKLRPFHLRYAVKKDTGWFITRVDSGWYTGYQTFLCLDSNDNPHISYTGDGWLKYAWGDGLMWHIEKIDSILPDWSYATYTGLALDENNYAHISYGKQIENGIMKYAKGYGIGVEVLSKGKYPTTELEVYPSIVQNEVEINYTLEKEGKVDISIYNVLGQKVAILVNKRRTAGKHTVCWDLKSSEGKKVSNGIYFCYLKNNTYLRAKVIIIK